MSKQTVINTPCGWKIGIGIDENGCVAIESTFENTPLSFVNNPTEKLSKVGAEMLARAIEDLYA